MSEEIARDKKSPLYMSAATMNGDKPLLRRGGPKGLLLSTWMNRSLRLEYNGARGEARETTATLLDVFPAGNTREHRRRQDLAKLGEARAGRAHRGLSNRGSLR